MKVVYVSHNAIGTPLVRSQVLPYLNDLAKMGVESWLVTFERGEAYPDGEFPRARWTGIRARAGGSLRAKALDLFSGAVTVAQLVLRVRADLVHARSYVPAAIAWLAGAITRRPYLFDMRGFLGEEYVEGGHWSERELRFRVLRAAEGALIGGSAELVALTRAGRARLGSDPIYARSRAKTISVIPCAVDLRRFHPAAERSEVPTIVYSGSLGMWYLLDEMLCLYAYARELVPNLRFAMLNRSDHPLIQSAIRRAGLEGADVVVRASDFGDMPGLVGRAHVGIALLRQVGSKVGSSPIKIAEYLACGLPVVVNAGLGDTDSLVRQYRAGVVVDAIDDAGLRLAARETVGLLHDKRAREAARRLAESEFDVAAGARTYAEIYARIARRAVSAAAGSTSSDCLG